MKWLNKQDLGGVVLARLKASFQLNNPEYIRAKKYGDDVSEIDEFLNFFEETEEWVGIPRCAEVESVGIEEVVVDDGRVMAEGVFNTPLLSLKPIQMEMIEASGGKECCMVAAPTGSGKTIFGLEWARLKGQKTIIVVNTEDIFGQWVNEIERYLGQEAGRIVGDVYEVRDVTVAMQQTLWSRRETVLREVSGQFGTVVFDECHRVPADTYQTTAQSFRAKYRLGVSGTARRADGLTDVMFWAFGEKAYDKELHEDDVRVVLKRIKTNSVYVFQAGTKTGWTYATGAMAKDNDRNRIICKIAKEEVDNGEKVLILSERVDHVKELVRMLTAKGMVAEVFVGAKNKAEKQKNDDIKERARKGLVDVVVSTYDKGSTGLDIPCLSVWIQGTPPTSKGGIEITQSVGRVKRPYPGKERAIIYDLIDGGTMGNYFFNRKRVYDELARKRKELNGEVV